MRRLTVLASEAGEVLGAMVHRAGKESQLKDPQGIQMVPMKGQVTVTVNEPQELIGREPNAEYLEALRGYTLRKNSLVKRR
jgi:hypothetical protein